MTKKKIKEVKKPKPKKEEQVMDGLSISFEEAMKVLSSPYKENNKVNKSETP